MKLIIAVALALVAVAAARPDVKEPVPIVRSQSTQDDKGYAFGYESADGSVREETGEVKEVLDEDKKPQTIVAIRGSYSYKDPEGNSETINYFADETGYHADGPSVPKAPVV